MPLMKILKVLCILMVMWPVAMLSGAVFVVVVTSPYYWLFEVVPYYPLYESIPIYLLFYGVFFWWFEVRRWQR